MVLDPTGAVTAPVSMLHDLQSDPVPPKGKGGVVAVTLVEAREDKTSRNRPRVASGSQVSGRIDTKKPPMALTLRYLMTPWSLPLPGESHQEERFLEHRMLGRVAQAFYDEPILSGTDLHGDGEPDSFDEQLQTGLAGSDDSLKISLAQLSFEEQTRFWHAVQRKYRVSLTYDVRVVNLEPTRIQSDSLVSDREIRYGVLKP